MNSTEIWKDIPNYEGIYQVSNFGNVKSLEKKVFYNDHRGFRINKERILKPSKNKGGYLYLILYKNGIKHTRTIHQLVAVSFLNHVPCGFNFVVDHINNIKTDNKLENLQIVSMRENSSKDKKTKYTGVQYSKRDNKWKASIKNKGINVFLGTFFNEIEAYEYYKKAVLSIENGTEIIKKENNFSSKYKGVSFHKGTGKWRAVYTIKNTKKSKSLGLYFSEIEAYKAYLKEASMQI